MPEHLHPILVHFPIALFVTALGLEILSLIFRKEILHRTALCNYILAILAALVAILVAWQEGLILKHPVFYSHKIWAYWTTGLALTSGVVLSLVKRKSEKIFRITFLIFLILTATMVLVTGYYGGKLVYEYGVGVEE